MEKTTNKRLLVAATVLLLVALIITSVFVGRPTAKAETTVEPPYLSECYMYLLPDFRSSDGNIRLSCNYYLYADGIHVYNGDEYIDFSYADFFVEGKTISLYLSDAYFEDNLYSKKVNNTVIHIAGDVTHEELEIVVSDVDDSFLEDVQRGYIYLFNYDEVYDYDFSYELSNRFFDFSIGYKWTIVTAGNWDYVCTFCCTFTGRVIFNTDYSLSNLDLDYSCYEWDDIYGLEESIAYNEYVESAYSLPATKTYTVNVLDYAPTTLAPFTWSLEWAGTPAYLDLSPTQYVELTPSADGMSCTVTIKRRFAGHDILLVCSGSGGTVRAICTLTSTS